MTSYSVDLDVVGALATPRTCPGCGGAELEPQTDQGMVTFGCGLCARVWYAEAGAMVTLNRFPAMRSENPYERRVTQGSA